MVESQEHLKGCLEEEQEITFLRLTKLIDSQEEAIKGVLLKNGELKPTVLIALSRIF
jgi:hypothetical protein